MNRELLIKQLIRHEGLKLKPYMDSVGKVTIGVGRNLADVGISEGEAADMLDHDIDTCVADLLNFEWYRRLVEEGDDVRMRALVDLRFNLGPQGFRTFKRFIAAMANGDYRRAGSELVDSKWYDQVGLGRAERLILMIVEGIE